MSKTYKHRKYYQLDHTRPSWKWQKVLPTFLIRTPLTIYGLRKDGIVLTLGSQNIFAYNNRVGILITPELKKAIQGWESFRLITYTGVSGESAERARQVLQGQCSNPVNFLGGLNA